MLDDMKQAHTHNGRGLLDKLHSAEFQRQHKLNYPPIEIESLEAAVQQILVAVGEDTQREGLKRTPHRVALAYEELLSGYRTDPVQLINDAVFAIEYDDPVIVQNIEFASLCEHHLLPFIGHAHIAYIPHGKVIGLSKIPRIVNMFARRLQLQEQMTHQIANFIDEILQPKGIILVIQATHMCSLIRGVKKQDSRMLTIVRRGLFKEDPQSQEMIMKLLFDDR